MTFPGAAGAAATVALAWLALAGIAGVALAIVAARRTLRFRHACRIVDEARIQSKRWAPSLSLAVLPSGDDAAVAETISTSLRLNYPGLEVIVVCDGGRGTLFTSLIQTFDFRPTFRVYRHEIRTSPIRAIYASSVFPNLLLVDKEEGGPSDALNAAIDVAASPLYAFVPTGTRLHPQALYRLLEEFSQAPESMAAACAPTRLGGERWSAAVNDASRAALTIPAGRGWSSIAAAAGSAGTFVVYRKKYLELVGGFRPDARNPRIDMSLRLPEKLRGWGVLGEFRFTPDPVAWEQADSALRLLWRRHAGLAESFGRHGAAMLRDGSGLHRAAGLYLAAAELFAPVMELLSYVALTAAWLSGALDATGLAAGGALLFGGPMIRAGISTIAECSDRDRYGNGQAARRLLAILLLPLGFHLVATLGRVYATIVGFRSSRRGSLRFSPTSRRFEPVTRSAVGLLPPSTPPPLPSLPAASPARPETKRTAAPAKAPPPPPPITWAIPKPIPPRAGPTTRLTTIGLPSPATSSMRPAPTAPGFRPVSESRPAPPAFQQPILPTQVPPPPPPITASQPAPPAFQQPLMPQAPTAGRSGPVTFDVMHHYQIRAEAPPGSMPAIQLPSGAGGPIVVTTASGQIAIPPTPTVPAAPQAPPPPPPAPVHPRHSRQSTGSGKQRSPGHHDSRGIASSIPAEPPPAPPAEVPTTGLTAPAIQDSSAVAEAPEAPPAPPMIDPEPVVTEPEAPAPEPEPAPAEPPADSAETAPDLEAAAEIENAPTAADLETVPPPADPETPAEAPAEAAAEEPPAEDIVVPSDETPPETTENSWLLNQAPPETVLDAGPTFPAPPPSEGPRPTSSASWPVVVGDQEIVSEPIDLGSLEEPGAEARPSDDTSATLPAVNDDQLSDPLDLGELDQDGLLQGLKEAAARSSSNPGGETSAMLPSVEDPSEPLDLDLRAPEEDAVSEMGSAVTLEAIEPGDLKRFLETIAQSTFFYGVRPHERNRIMSFLRVVTAKPGKDILREGQPGRGLFIIQSGKIDVLQDEGRKHIASLVPGQCFGEMSLLTGDPASATVRAAEESRLLCVTKEEFPKLTRALPWIVVALAREIASRINRTSARVVEDLKKGMVGRLELVSPASLVQAVNVNAQTGSLSVQSGRRSFTGYFEEGQLLEATGEFPSAEESFYDFCSWTSGSFRFEPVKREAAKRNVMTDTVGLLLEGTRRVDELRSAGGAQAPNPAQVKAESGVREVVREKIEFSLSDETAAKAALSRLPIFSGLRDEQLSEVVAAMQEKRTSDGDLIVRQGQLGQALYIVGAGPFDVSTRDEVGVQNKLATLGPGDCFGEISLITGEPTSATVAAAGDGRLLVIPRAEFHELLGKVPALGGSLARILASRLAKASKWVNEQSRQGIAGRLETMAPAELVQALNVNAQSGVLIVQSENKTVEVDFLDGQIQDARSGELRGDEAFFKLLTWSKGGFRFKGGRPTGEKTVQSDTIGLLFRGMRHIEQARATAAAEGRSDLVTSDLTPKETKSLPSTDTGTMRELPPELRKTFEEAPAETAAAPAEPAPAAAPDASALQPISEAEAEDCLETVASSSLFFHLRPEDRHRILPLLRTASVAAGTVVVQEGAPGRALYLVRAGRFEVVRGGESRPLALLGPGECYGEMSLLTGDPASASVRAIEDAKVIAIPQEEFPRLTEALPWLGSALTRLIAQRLMRTSQVLFQEHEKGMRGRLELVPPSALVQAVHANLQSGSLTVKKEAPDPAPTFTARIREGEIVEAAIDGIPGEDAFYQFLGWDSGDFSFEPGPPGDAARSIKTDTVSLLLEGNRRIDEQRRGGGPAHPKGLTTSKRKKGGQAPEMPSLSSPQAAVEALGKLPLFRGLDEAQRLEVVTLMRERKTAARETVVEQDRAAQALYIIADGRFDVTQTDRGGADRKLATLTPGECFGEEALITGEPSNTTVVSRDPGRLYEIPRDSFGPLLGRLPALGAALARILAGRLARTSAWIAEQAKTGLVGQLESMPAAELVQALNVNSQSGTLSVTNENKTIEIDFLDGQVQDARVEDLKGEEAFFLFLAWTRGAFQFAPGRPSPKRSVELDTMGLLFRGLRQLERARSKKAEATGRKNEP